MDAVKIGVTVVLALIAGFLGYKLASGIQGPIKFDADSSKRYKIVETKLEKIKEAQDAYLKVNGHFADNWDSLFQVVKMDSLNVDTEIKVRISEYDKDEFTSKYGIHLKEEYGDTMYYKLRFIKKIAIVDSLFNDADDVPLQDLDKIPFGDRPQFHIASSEVSAAGGRYFVPVYHVTAPNKHILAGLNKDYFYPNHGYELGSLFEPNTEIVLRKEDVDYPE